MCKVHSFNIILTAIWSDTDTMNVSTTAAMQIGA